MVSVVAVPNPYLGGALFLLMFAPHAWRESVSRESVAGPSFGQVARMFEFFQDVWLLSNWLPAFVDTTQ